MGPVTPSRFLRGTALAPAGLLLALSLSPLVAGPVVAADPVTFGTATATSAFGKSIEFTQPLELPAAPERVELLVRTPGTNGSGVIEAEAPRAGGKQILRFSLDLVDGHIYPNTPFTARWRVTTPDGTIHVGPEVSHTYADDRMKWRTVVGDIVRVHWYEGDAAFGRRALGIGDRAVAETAKLLGVTETEPIDFYIYADQDRFYDALGPGTRENVGGEAHADIRTMFALIAPAEIGDNWVDVVVPHELTHLVFNTATENPYHDPPHWLNEGLAVYLSEGFTSSDRNAVERAAADGTIIALEGLAGAFPTTRDRFVLAYAESTSAVDHIIATYGRDDLVALIRSYATGLSDDEAFTAALGIDVGGFEAEWLRSVGASPPLRHGPQPAPPGPVPEGWSGAAPAPSVIAGPGASEAPGGVPVPPGGSSLDLRLVALAAMAVVGAALIGGVLVGRRLRQPRP